MDVNDRSLRYIITGLHGGKNGIPAETGFDITPASELMAILCLAKDQDDLRSRIDNILLATTAGKKTFPGFRPWCWRSNSCFTERCLTAQPCSNTGGYSCISSWRPFANIAHGCNSLIATKNAMNLADYVITEAGFGSDLGAEKFFNIKCRTAGITPALSVLVVTTQSLKLHGEVPYAKIASADPEGIMKGMRNLERHLHILRTSISRCLWYEQVDFDTDEELLLIRNWCEQRNVPYAVNNAYNLGRRCA